MLGVAIMIILLAAMLCLAGRVDWAFVLFNLPLFAALLVGLGQDVGLVGERISPGPGTKWWERVFFLFYGSLNGAVFVVASLDGGRYFWTPAIMWLFPLGGVVLVRG